MNDHRFEKYEDYKNLKEKYQDKILLLHVGFHYETFDKDAKDVSDILGIPFVWKDPKSAHNYITYEGGYTRFTYKMLPIYLARLVRACRRVAVADL